METCFRCKKPAANLSWPDRFCSTCYIADAELSIAVNALYWADQPRDQEWGQNRVVELYWEDVNMPNESVLPGLEAFV